MKILGLAIAIYTPVMLLIHLTTSKILEAWNKHPTSWISRRLPPRRALRVEGVYWVLALAAWPLWQPAAWKILVVIFALIHLGIWGASELSELRAGRKKGYSFGIPPKMNQAIVIFDSAEAVVLVALGVVAILYLSHPR